MMENDGLLKTIEELLTEDLRQMVLSGRMQADGPMKVRLRPVLTGGALKFQAEEFVGKQAFHKNLPKEEAESYVTGLLGTSFKQLQAETAALEASVLVSKKGKVTIHKKKKAEPALSDAWRASLSHNRKKHYILEEGIPVPFLVDLGVQTKDGNTVMVYSAGAGGVTVRS